MRVLYGRIWACLVVLACLGGSVCEVFFVRILLPCITRTISFEEILGRCVGVYLRVKCWDIMSIFWYMYKDSLRITCLYFTIFSILSTKIWAFSFFSVMLYKKQEQSSMKTLLLWHTIDIIVYSSFMPSVFLLFQ